jgi:DNA-binding MarR family transcriptional regulator
VVVDLTPAAEELLTAEARAREAWLTDTLEQLSAQERTVLREAAVIMDELASG